MTAPIDDKTLRQCSPPELAALLRAQLQHHGWQKVSAHLLESVASGSLPVTVFHVWMSVCKDPAAVAALLRQHVSQAGRHAAMRRFGKCLRKDDSFLAMWQAVGGTEGIASLMATLSVGEVRTMCESIAFAYSAPGAMKQRQEAVTELYNTLCGTGAVPNPDRRPLREVYGMLVSACTAETALLHNKDQQPDRKSARLHRAVFEKRAWEEMFPAQGEHKKTISEFTDNLDRSWRFALQVLQHMTTNSAALDANKDVFLSSLSVPLLKRLVNRALRQESQLALELVAQCMENVPRIAELTTWGTSGVLYFAVQHWARIDSSKREKAEQILRRLIVAVPKKSGCSRLELVTLLTTVNPGLRYPLLCLVMRNGAQFSVDIDDMTEETDQKFKAFDEKWPASLFYEVLPPRAALGLFRRLAKAHPDAGFIEPVRHQLLRSRFYNQNQNNIMFVKAVGEEYSDPDVACAYLESLVSLISGDAIQETAWFDRAKRQLAERKKKAENTREWEDRAAWAVSALDLAIATGSLDVYADTLIWARRFNRDPQTVTMLYAEKTILTYESLDLLAAVPSTQAHGSMLEPDRLSAAVKKSNEIMVQLLETLAKAIQEPSFQRYHWAGVFRLIPEVLRRRLEKVEALQEKLGLSEKDTWTAILEPSIDLVLHAERFGLREEHEELRLCEIGGPLRNWGEVKPTEPMGMFLDKLSERRDQLWVEYRVQRYPAATTLTKPWPRGLPIQDLYPRLKLEKHGLTGLHHLQARAESVAFTDASALGPQPDDTELKEAIGPFVDDYRFALRIYLAGAQTEDDRDSRITRAWQHATTVLTGDRMSESEATLYWKQVFCSIPHMDRCILGPDLERLKLVPTKLELLKDVFPQLPEQDDDGPTEWDPYPTTVPIVDQAKPTELTRTSLDCLLWSGHRTSKVPFSPFIEATSIVPTLAVPGVWQLHTYRRSDDAFAAAAIASINSACGSDHSLLRQPFPSTRNARFPAFYLDQEFLERSGNLRDGGKSIHMQPIWDVLDGMAAYLPLPLLVRLADSLLTRLESGEKVNPEILESAINAIKMLVRGDRPELACRLVRHVILDRQEDSSWHRHLFNAGFLNRLSADDAKTFIDTLSTEIVQRSERRAQAQSKRQAEAQGPPDLADASDVPTQEQESSKVAKPAAESFTRVSTVKSIAQILRSAGFVSQEYACKVLVDIMNASKHPDIRIAVAESLTSTLVTTHDTKLQDFIYKILEDEFIPIASSINERSPPREAMWLAAEKGDGPLPDVYPNANQSLPPIMSLLLGTTARWGKDTPQQDRWISRILLPLVERSAANNARWTALFARRHGFEIPEGSLPAIPISQDLLSQCWKKYRQAFTRSNFEILKCYARVHIRPHSGLLAANEAIEKDSDLLKSDAGRHWLALWDRSRRPDSVDNGVVQIIDALQTKDFDKVEGFSVTEMQSFIKESIHDLIDSGRSTDFWSLISRLRVSSAKKDLWTTNCLPILESTIRTVDELRTPAWQQNPQRHPRALPSTYNIKMQIMEERHKQYNWDTPSQAAFSAHAAEMFRLIEELVGIQIAYHDEWMSFVNRTQTAVLDKHYLDLAVTLAELLPKDGNQFRLADYLAFDLVNKLMLWASWSQDGMETKGDLLAKARTIIQGWMDSPVESIRVQAKITDEALFPTEKSDWDVNVDTAW